MENLFLFIFLLCIYLNTCFLRGRPTLVLMRTFIEITELGFLRIRIVKGGDMGKWDQTPIRRQLILSFVNKLKQGKGFVMFSLHILSCLP